MVTVTIILFTFYKRSRTKEGTSSKTFQSACYQDTVLKFFKKSTEKIALVSIPAAGIGWGWRSSVTVGQNSVGEVLAHQQLERGKGVPGSMNWLDFRCQWKAGYLRRFQRYPTIHK